jgi:hypothetical protein
MGSLTPMLAEVENRTGQTPGAILADAGHANHECICNLMDREILPFVSVPESSKNPGPNANFDPRVDAWRESMQTEAAKKLYRNRAGLCEHSQCSLQESPWTGTIPGARPEQGYLRRPLHLDSIKPTGSWTQATRHERLIERIAILLRRQVDQIKKTSR